MAPTWYLVQCEIVPRRDCADFKTIAVNDTIPNIKDVVNTFLVEEFGQDDAIESVLFYTNMSCPGGMTAEVECKNGVLLRFWVQSCTS